MSASWHCYSAFENILKQSEQNPDTTKLLKVVHEAVARHDNAPRCHYASHEQRRSFEHVEDGITGHLCIFSQHPLDHSKVGVRRTSQSVGYDCDNLEVSQMIAGSEECLARVDQDYVLHNVNEILKGTMTTGALTKRLPTRCCTAFHSS